MLFAIRLNAPQTATYPKANSALARLAWGPPRCFVSAITNRMAGAALGSIIAAIMMIHMRKIIAAYWTVHAGAISMIWPPPMSISSIRSPAPVSNQTHDSTITATRPTRTSVRSWRRRALSTTALTG